MKTTIIANPIAGNGRGQRYADALEQALQERGIETTLHITANAGDGQRLANTVEGGYIAVVGGDGTVNEVLNGLSDNSVCLAILAAGSVNVVARQLQFPQRPEVLADWITAAKTRPMDVLECGGRRAILGGGAGFDAAVAERVNASRGDKLGLWRWVMPTLQTVWARPYPMIRVTVDDREVCAASPYVIVGNCPFSAGSFRATPRAKTDDGLLDVVAVKRFGPLKMISLALGSFLPSFPERADLVYVQGRHVDLEPVDNSRVPLQLDGDPAGTLPAQFDVLPDACTVLAPPQKPSPSR